MVWVAFAADMHGGGNLKYDLAADESSRQSMQRLFEKVLWNFRRPIRPRSARRDGMASYAAAEVRVIGIVELPLEGTPGPGR